MDAVTWRARSSLDFDWRLWGDEALVYVHATGETHALNPAASLVLATLIQHPGESHAVEPWLARVIGDEAPSDGSLSGIELEAEREAVLQALIELAKIGVVCKAAP